MLADLFARYGYGLVFLAAAVEGDATLVTGSFLAHRGYLSLDGVMMVAALGTVFINQVYFWTARRYGQTRTASLRTHHAVGRVVEWIARFGLPLVIVSRFIYGFRIAIPAACGVIRMSPARFVIGDVIGSIVWALIVGFAGYTIGHSLTRLVADLRAHEWWIAVLLAAGIVAVHQWSRHRSRRNQQA